jgi:magnesium-transporting ATPase (P-type)
VSVPDTLTALRVNPETGLARVEVDVRRKEHGYNEVAEQKGQPWRMFLGKFWGLSAWMLELIMVVSADVLAGADGFAEVYPEDKYIVVQRLQAAGHVTGMTGDGVNDAPALRQAEVGIAVSTATDVAKGAASVVLTEPGLTNIVAGKPLDVFPRIARLGIQNS